MQTPVYLVTGSMGCIGAWTLRHLIDQDANVVATDLDMNPARPRLLMNEDELKKVQWQKLDVTDLQAVNAIAEKYAVTHIVHLAGLQIPFCRANPSLGASVNVTGTINLLEAARQYGIKGFSYASSLAVLGPDDSYPDKPVKDDVPRLPSTLYGVYKTANEDTAKIYWQDWQVSSIGLRPYCVYGVARDQGMTADIAKAILAAAAGKPFHIRFDGPVAVQHASDVAQIFIYSANAQYQGATVCNLRGDVLEISDFIMQLKQLSPDAQISCEANSPLPYPADLDDSRLNEIVGSTPHTPLAAAIEKDISHYRRLLSGNLIDLEQLKH